MPRRYDLGKRTDQKAETRRRILVAAADLYREQGATRTSMAQVARRADVAVGTVRNHFPTTDALAREVAGHVLGELRAPGVDLFDGLSTTPERIRAFARELGAFYERSEPWYRMPRLEPHPVDAWVEAEAGYYAELDRTIRAALGSRAAEAEAVAVVAAMLEPAVFATLRSRGMTTIGAADQIAEVLVAWLEPGERAVRR